MNRKARQAAEATMRECGAVAIAWEHGGKHEIATCRFGSGRYLDIVLARGYTDDVQLRQTVRRVIRRDLPKQPVVVGGTPYKNVNHTTSQGAFSTAPGEEPPIDEFDRWDY